jgi:hypothetical protein
MRNHRTEGGVSRSGRCVGVTGRPREVYLDLNDGERCTWERSR